MHTREHFQACRNEFETFAKNFQSKQALSDSPCRYTTEFWTTRNKICIAREFYRYSDTYNVSPLEAISDRDYPMTRAEVCEALLAMFIEPTEANVRFARPDSEDSVERSRREFDESVRR